MKKTGNGYEKKSINGKAGHVVFSLFLALAMVWGTGAAGYSVSGNGTGYDTGSAFEKGAGTGAGSAVFSLAENSAAYATDYAEYTERILQNGAMYKEAEKMSAKEREKYLDKSLSDMFETDYRGMTVSEQAEIKAFADKLIRENGYPYSTEGKLKVFHDWIKKNFYYYRYVTELDFLTQYGSKVDSPITLLRCYQDYGKVAARCNGYTAMFVALARSQDIPACALAGYYNTATRRNGLGGTEWNVPGSEDSSTVIETHQWSMAYSDYRWIVVDCNADCYNQYYSADHDCYWYTSKESYRAGNEDNYFNPTAARLAQSHIIYRIRGHIKMTNEDEKNQLKAFLEQSDGAEKNGTRVYPGYSQYDPGTWFNPSDVSSESNSAGKLRKLYIYGDADTADEDKLVGELHLNGFSALQNIQLKYNNLTKVTLSDCPSLHTVSLSHNNVEEIEITGAGNMTLLNLLSNPVKSAVYNFRGDSVARVTSDEEGYISLNYSTSTGKPVHKLIAHPDKGYVLKSWYDEDGNKLSGYKTFEYRNSDSFTAFARFLPKKPTLDTISILMTSGCAKLTWNEVYGAEKYYIYRSTSKNGKFSYVGATGKNYYTDKNSLPGTTVYYKVKTFRNNELSDYSAYKSATHRFARPSLRADDTALKLRWDVITGAQRYELVKLDDETGKYNTVKLTTLRYYTVPHASGSLTETALEEAIREGTILEEDVISEAELDGMDPEEYVGLPVYDPETMSAAEDTDNDAGTDVSLKNSQEDTASGDITGVSDNNPEYTDPDENRTEADEPAKETVLVTKYIEVTDTYKVRARLKTTTRGCSYYSVPVSFTHYKPVTFVMEAEKTDDLSDISTEESK